MLASLTPIGPRRFPITPREPTWNCEAAVPDLFLSNYASPLHSPRLPLLPDQTHHPIRSLRLPPPTPPPPVILRPPLGITWTPQSSRACGHYLTYKTPSPQNPTPPRCSLHLFVLSLTMSELSPPRKSVELEDPGAHELGLTCQ